MSPTQTVQKYHRKPCSSAITISISDDVRRTLAAYTFYSDSDKVRLARALLTRLPEYLPSSNMFEYLPSSNMFEYLPSSNMFSFVDIENSQANDRIWQDPDAELSWYPEGLSDKWIESCPNVSLLEAVDEPTNIFYQRGSRPIGYTRYTRENAYFTEFDEPWWPLSMLPYRFPDGWPGKQPQGILSKVKRGLPGFVNGARVSALPDTGCSRNLVSLAFVQEMKLAIHGSPADFKLGNSRHTKSLGTVTLDWAFSDSPRDLSKIICDVLPNCNYSVILGSRFLTATQTLSKYKRRLTECLFSTVNVPRLNFLECDNSRLHGYVCGRYGEELIEVAALPDTGAERNVMDRNFAVKHGLYIHKGPSHRNLLQFADGTYQETVGQVEARWKFESGEFVPLTFEVLEDCCSDVILGDAVLYDHNVFEDHAASISSHEPQHDIHQLAPFDFVKNWQRHYGSLLHRFSDRKNRTKTQPAHHTDNEEAERQETWNYQYSFGETATEAEKAAEQLRRDTHKLASQSSSSAPPEAQSQHPRTFSIPSIATAPNHIRQPSSRTSTHPQREGYR